MQIKLPPLKALKESSYREYTGKSFKRDHRPLKTVTNAAHPLFEAAINLQKPALNTIIEVCL